MQRLWILAILACGTMLFSGCGGEKKETADNSSNASDSSSSSRPKRNGGGEAKSSGGEKMQGQGGMGSGGGMSGDPERRNGKANTEQMQGQGGMGSGMRGDPRQMEDPTKGSGPKKPDHISQEQWDSFSPEVKERYGGLVAAGGGNRPPPSAGQAGGMKGDPRQNGGGGGGNDISQGEMSGDPRQNGGGGNDGAIQSGGMQGDPRQGGGGGGASGSTPPDGGGFNGSSTPPGGSRFGGQPGRPGFGGPNGRANAAPQTLKEKALKAFEDGDDDGGFQLMYGHFVAEDEGRGSIPLQFMPTIKRPRTAMRWGVGVVMKSNKGFEGAPPKIGEKPNVLPQPRGSRNRGNNGFGGPPTGSGGAGGAPPAGGAGAGGFGRNNAGSPSNGGMEELKYYTGEVGEVLVEMLDKLRVRGQFGKMIAKVNHSAGGGGGRGNGFGGGGRPSGGGTPTLDDGRTGPDPSGGAGGFSRNSQANRRASADAASQYKNVLPGVLMLGKSSLKSLAARAKAHGIEMLVIFDVNCKLVPSTGQKINDTKVSIYDVTGSAPVRVGKPSSTLNNIRVWMSRDKNPGEENDPIRNGVKKIFEQGKEDGLLATYKIGTMPELNQGQVMNRITSLVEEGQASGNPMPAMVELTYYRQKGLLPEKAYVESINKLAGTEIGDTLLNGAEEDRVKAIGSLLPPEWKVNEAAGGGDDTDVL